MAPVKTLLVMLALCLSATQAQENTTEVAEENTEVAEENTEEAEENTEVVEENTEVAQENTGAEENTEGAEENTECACAAEENTTETDAPEGEEGAEKECSEDSGMGFWLRMSVAGVVLSKLAALIVVEHPGSWRLLYKYGFLEGFVFMGLSVFFEIADNLFSLIATKVNEETEVAVDLIIQTLASLAYLGLLFSINRILLALENRHLHIIGFKILTALILGAVFATLVVWLVMDLEEGQYGHGFFESGTGWVFLTGLGFNLVVLLSLKTVREEFVFVFAQIFLMLMVTALVLGFNNGPGLHVLATVRTLQLEPCVATMLESIEKIDESQNGVKNTEEETELKQNEPATTSV